MTIIGLTGKSGAGKNTVAEILKKFNIAHIDCDRVARKVTEPGHLCLIQLSDIFPSAIRSDGSLNRKELATLCFGNKSKLHMLNEITHRHILNELDIEIDQLKAQGFRYVCVNGAALIESGFAAKCDKMVCVHSSEDRRLKRIMERDMLTLDEAKHRMTAQHEDKFYTDKADYIIENNGKPDDLFEAVADVAIQITKQSKED